MARSQRHTAGVSSKPENTLARDRRLVAAANAGDASAFEELYRLYRDWIFSLAMRFVAQAADAEDVLQETFSYLLSKPPHLRLSGRLTSFLYPVVKHLASHARNRRARYRDGGEALDHLTSSAVDSGRADRRELALVLCALPEPQREVLLMRTVDDMTLSEIADALGIPLGTVKSRLHHALAWLRDDERTRAYFEA